jgi:hypothetical protein
MYRNFFRKLGQQRLPQKSGVLPTAQGIFLQDCGRLREAQFWDDVQPQKNPWRELTF